MSKIRICVYRNKGEWFGARWIDGEYDGSDPLDCDDDSSDTEAFAAARNMQLAVDGDREIVRVSDV